MISFGTLSFTKSCPLCNLKPVQVIFSRYLQETSCKYQSLLDDVQSARTITLKFILFELLAPLNNVHRKLLYYPLASALTLVSTNVKVFKTSLFPNLITDMIHLWYNDTYWSTILCSTIPTTLGHVKVKVTDLEFSCKI